MKTVFLTWICDQWLSNDAKSLVAVSTTNKRAIELCRSHLKNVFKTDFKWNEWEELNSENQVRLSDLGFYIEEVELYID
ncbi:MAG: hypothetical protein WDA08_02150 [Weeksellaceae bacterium]|jgi:hypothetical protein